MNQPVHKSLFFQERTQAMMNDRRHVGVWTLAVFIAVAALGASFAKGEDAEGFENIFNGKDLTGWEGLPESWGVEDGALVTKVGGPKTYLIWKGGELADFELRLKFRISSGNSGIQFRSKRVDNPKHEWTVGGYQADLDAGHRYTGALYGELIGGFGAGQKRTAKPEIKQEGEWNDYVIVAEGGHIVLKVNGTVTVDVTKEDGARTGILAFQHHGGNVQAEFKDIQVKRLAAAP
jgi:hypothetical protein